MLFRSRPSLEKIRKDFPLLSQPSPPVYFDNACQSLRPQTVIDSLKEYYTEFPVCAGRSAHSLARKVTQKITSVRQKTATFIGAQRPEEIIFTRNTTEGVNLLATAWRWQKEDRVITTDKEHNSNLIPWQRLQDRGVIHQVIPSQKDNTFDLSRFQQKMQEGQGKIKLVAMGWTSNLDGISLPVKEIIDIAHHYKALVFLDAAQTVSHLPINVSALDIDFLAFSGHKVLGPSGTGVFYGKYSLLEQLQPFQTGGDTVQTSTYENHTMLAPPAKFEAGLQDYAGIIGLEAALQYIQSIGFPFIQEQELKLNHLLAQGLRKISSQIKILGPTDPRQRGGIVSFYVPGLDHHQIALMLNEYNIAVRSGQHCVHSWFSAHEPNGTIRASLAFYNTEAEVNHFLQSMQKILNLLS